MAAGTTGREPRAAGWSRLVGVALVAMQAGGAEGFWFEPCPEPGHEAFECATLEVPLDRSGTVPGTVPLHVERLMRTVPPEGVVVALAGGPGQSATRLAPWFAFKLQGLLERFQLVVFDQRGTGLSGPLACPDDPDEIAAARRCAAVLGPAADFYTTADSVADLEAVREALGATRILIYAVSYGTWVAMEYARAHPEHVERLVLDSPLSPDGPAAIRTETIKALPPAVATLCADSGCPEVQGDLARLARRIASRPLRGSIPTVAGGTTAAELDEEDLWLVIQAGDLRQELRRMLPAALVASRRGDHAPLLRLRALAYRQRTVATPARDEEDPDRSNEGVFLATRCTDTHFPWPAAASLRQRRAAAAHALRAVPSAALAPFGHRSLRAASVLDTCLGWPRTSLARARIGGPIPAGIPILVLQGLGDVRTPPANAWALAAGRPDVTVILVPGEAHSVGHLECAQEAVTAFAAGVPVAAEACEGHPRRSVMPDYPRRLAEIALSPGHPCGTPGRLAWLSLATIWDVLALFQLFGDVPGGQVAGMRGGVAEQVAVDGDTRRIAIRRYALVEDVTIDGILVVPPQWSELRASLRLRWGQGMRGRFKWRGKGWMDISESLGRSVRIAPHPESVVEYCPQVEAPADLDRAGRRADRGAVVPQQDGRG